MTSQQENSQTESSIDRRLFLGAAGALTLAGQSALAQGAQTETKAETKPADAAKRLSDTIADFVFSFDATTLPPLAVERVRLAFIGVHSRFAISRRRLVRWQGHWTGPEPFGMLAGHEHRI